MKIIKRILAVMFVILAVLVMGYLLFTCSGVNEDDTEDASVVGYEQTEYN